MREDMASVLANAQKHALKWLGRVEERPVRATATSEELRGMLGGPLPESGAAPEKIVENLAKAAERGTSACSGPRYFGFVIGGSLPAAMAADWLV